MKLASFAKTFGFNSGFGGLACEPLGFRDRGCKFFTKDGVMESKKRIY